jgi:hypothetical protein
VVVDSRQFLGSTPGIFKYLDEYVAYQGLLNYLRVLFQIKSSEEILTISCFFDSQEIFIIQAI